MPASAADQDAIRPAAKESRSALDTELWPNSFNDDDDRRHTRGFRVLFRSALRRSCGDDGDHDRLASSFVTPLVLHRKRDDPGQYANATALINSNARCRTRGRDGRAQRPIGAARKRGISTWECRRANASAPLDASGSRRMTLPRRSGTEGSARWSHGDQTVTVLGHRQRPLETCRRPENRVVTASATVGNSRKTGCAPCPR